MSSPSDFISQLFDPQPQSPSQGKTSQGGCNTSSSGNFPPQFPPGNDPRLQHGNASGINAQTQLWSDHAFLPNSKQNNSSFNHYDYCSLVSNLTSPGQSSNSSGPCSVSNPWSQSVSPKMGEVLPASPWPRGTQQLFQNNTCPSTKPDSNFKSQTNHDVASAFSNSSNYLDWLLNQNSKTQNGSDCDLNSSKFQNPTSGPSYFGSSFGNSTLNPVYPSSGAPVSEDNKLDADLDKLLDEILGTQSWSQQNTTDNNATKSILGQNGVSVFGGNNDINLMQNQGQNSELKCCDHSFCAGSKSVFGPGFSTASTTTFCDNFVCDAVPPHFADFKRVQVSQNGQNHSSHRFHHPLQSHSAQISGGYKSDNKCFNPIARTNTAAKFSNPQARRGLTFQKSGFKKITAKKENGTKSLGNRTVTKSKKTVAVTRLSMESNKKTSACSPNEYSPTSQILRVLEQIPCHDSSLKKAYLTHLTGTCKPCYFVHKVGGCKRKSPVAGPGLGAAAQSDSPASSKYVCSASRCHFCSKARKLSFDLFTRVNSTSASLAKIPIAERRYKVAGPVLCDSDQFAYRVLMKTGWGKSWLKERFGELFNVDPIADSDSTGGDI